MKQFLKIGLALFAGSTLFFGCDDTEFEQSTVAFSSDKVLTLPEGSEEMAEFELLFSRPLDMDGSFTVEITSETAQQGIHYETDITSFVAGRVRVTAPAGSNSASFSIRSLEDEQFTNGHTLRMEVVEASGGVRSSAGNPATLLIEDNDPPTTRALFDFEDCGERYETPPAFTEVRVPGSKTDRGWGCQPFGFEGQGVQASGFSGESGVVNAWLLLDLDSMPSVDPASYEALFISFMVESYFDGAGTIEMKYSTEYPGTGNPEDYPWTVLPIAEQLPPPGSGQENAPDGFWKEVFVDASQMAGKKNVHIAIQYDGASNTSSASWTIDDLTFYGD